MKQSTHIRLVRGVIVTSILLFIGLLLVSVGRGETAPRVSPAPAAITWQPTKATWYGPGYYGNRFACANTPGLPDNYGQRTRGVAVNRAFARCGAKFTVRFQGRVIRVQVIDRCPGCGTGRPGDRGHLLDLTARSMMDLQGCRSYCKPYTKRVSFHGGWS